MELAPYLAERQRRVNQTLERLLPPAADPARGVTEGMRYAVLGPGKRLRPILALAAHEACGGAGAMDEPAAALELIHTYSLVHDDLPAMDDDDLRRGRPTVHRVYGEAQAILVGDALLTLAFEILAGRPAGPEAALRRSETVCTVARRVGAAGMIGGQAVDLEAERRKIDGEELSWIHRHKTGALFSACAETGAIHAGAAADARAAMAAYGEALGLAFQVADDILDRTASSARLGKTAGKDRRAGKATYPALFGIDGSRVRAARLVELALEGLRGPGLLTEPLEALARHAVARTH